jgi:DICT domain-containing protein
MALGVRYSGVEKTEFAPYLTAFLNLKEGERWNEIDFKPAKSYGHSKPWQLKGRVLGEETVTVPAGKFKAIKVEVTGVRETEITSRFAPSVIQHILWYVPEIKRVVRQESNSSSAAAQLRGDRDIYELVAYKPASKTPAPANQVASAATPGELAAAAGLSAALPSIGDSWTYRHVDGWKNTTVSTIDYKVTAVSPMEVRERVTGDGQPQKELAYGNGLMAIGVRYGDVEKTEFSPYLSGFMKLEKDQRFSDIEFKTDRSYGYGHPWMLKARVVGEETVTVPAGKFQAIKVEVTGTRDTEVRSNSSGMLANAIQHTLWYVPAIKRVVRQESNSSTASAQWRGDRDVYELVSYKLK